MQRKIKKYIREKKKDKRLFKDVLLPSIVISVKEMRKCKKGNYSLSNGQQFSIPDLDSIVQHDRVHFSLNGNQNEMEKK